MDRLLGLGRFMDCSLTGGGDEDVNAIRCLLWRFSLDRVLDLTLRRWHAGV